MTYRKIHFKFNEPKILFRSWGNGLFVLLYSFLEQFVELVDSAIKSCITDCKENDFQHNCATVDNKIIEPQIDISCAFTYLVSSSVIREIK